MSRPEDDETEDGETEDGEWTILSSLVFVRLQNLDKKTLENFQATKNEKIFC